MASETRILMGMPITVEIVGAEAAETVSDVFGYFAAVDARFSLYKPDSEITRFNEGCLPPSELSEEMRDVLILADRTRRETQGYFDIHRPDGVIDPSGIVKGWAVRNAAHRIEAAGFKDFFVDVGGDIQAGGRNSDGEVWRIGIHNPFDETQIIKALTLDHCGIATSGSYVRGQHIYDPHRPRAPLTNIVSLTVIAGDVLEADRFATAAFAMGKAGICFIEAQPGLEGYSVDPAGIARQTSGFKVHVTQ